MALGTAVAPAVRVSAMLSGMAMTLPFLVPFHAYPLASFYSEWLAFALGLGAASLLLWPRVWQPLRLPTVALAPLALSALILLQWLLGWIEYSEQALTAVLYLLWMVAMMVLGGALQREIGITELASVLAWALLAGGVLSAGAALLQHYQVHTFLDPIVAQRGPGGVYGNVGQQNHLADFSALAVASLAYLTASRRLHSVAAVALAPLLLVVMALTASRGTWLYLAALVVLAFGFNRRAPGPDSRRLAIVALALAAGFVLLQWAASLPFLIPEPRAVATEGRRLFDFAQGNSQRFALWREAWSTFLQSPLLGAGFGQFAWQHFQLGAAAGTAAAPGLYNHAHNIVLQLLAETGLAGALIAAAGIAVWIAGLKRLQAGLHGWWLLALLAVLGIHSLLEFPLSYAYFLGIAALLLGAGATRFVAADGRGISRISIAVALLLGSFVAVTTLGSYRELERILFTAQRDESAIPPEPEFTEVLMRIHRESLLTPYVEFAMTFAIVPDRERLKDKLELNARVMRFAPADTVVYRHTLLLALNGEHAAALEQLRRAAAMYPGELPGYARTLAVLARRFPGTFEPLLEFVHTRAGPGAER